MTEPIRTISALATEHTNVPDLAAAILAEYERAWLELANGREVRSALGFEEDEHFWIACYPPSGAVQIARRRMRTT